MTQTPPPPRQVLYQVHLPPRGAFTGATFGLVGDAPEEEGGIVRRAAPIAGWARRKSLAYVLGYYRRRPGARVTFLSDSATGVGVCRDPLDVPWARTQEPR